MRLKLVFGPNDKLVPNNMSVTNSWLHKCLGENNGYHDSHSDYCVSKLSGGELVDGGKSFNFPRGGYIIISTEDNEFMEIIMKNIDKVELGYGMDFQIALPISEDIYDGYNFFKTMDTGLLLKSFENGVEKNHTINDDDFIEILTNKTINRLRKINPRLKFDDFKIEISENIGNKVKRTFVGRRANISSVCQLTIHSNKKVAQAIYNYGLGQSTGSGFGLVYKVENKKLYARN